MKLDHLVILVRSLETSLPWYTCLLGALGFAKTRDHVWVNEEGVAIDLKQAGPETRDYERTGPGLNHLGFTAGDRQQHDAVRARMAAAGFDVPDTQDFRTSLATFFKDPDGMRIEVADYA